MGVLSCTYACRTEVTLKIKLGYYTERPLGVLKCIMPCTKLPPNRNPVSKYRNKSIGRFCNLMAYVGVEKCMAKTVHGATPIWENARDNCCLRTKICGGGLYLS